MTPNTIVIHYTAAGSKSSIGAFSSGKGVSIHYIIDVDGVCISYKNAMQYGCRGVVPEDVVAWHAGVSFWRGLTSVNQRSIGIELVNFGCAIPESVIQKLDTEEVKLDKKLFPNQFTIWQKFPQKQIDVLLTLCLDLIKHYNIKPWNIVWHSDISLGRKIDPGPLFPHSFFAENGVGMKVQDISGYFDKANEILSSNIGEVAALFSRFGYGVHRNDWVSYFAKYKTLFQSKNDNYFLMCAVLSFKMHYCSKLYNNYLTCDLDATVVSALLSLTSTIQRS